MFKVRALHNHSNTFMCLFCTICQPCCLTKLCQSGRLGHLLSPADCSFLCSSMAAGIATSKQLSCKHWPGSYGWSVPPLQPSEQDLSTTPFQRPACLCNKLQVSHLRLSWHCVNICLARIISRNIFLQLSASQVFIFLCHAGFYNLYN